jgi:hypothetical protein
MAVCLLEMLCV